jgi:hypothetical protein
MFDIHSILASSTIASIVSQDTTTLVVNVQSGHGARFSTNQQVTLTPAGQRSSLDNSMVGRITAISNDELTIDITSAVREGTSEFTVGTGWQIGNGFTPKILNDIENQILLPDTISNQTAKGIKMVLTAGENLVFGDVCYIKSDGKMWRADADAIVTASAIGISLGTITANETGEFLLHGIIINDSWNWTVGGKIYLSTATGEMTQTAPSGTDDVIQLLGIATHDTQVYFNPQLIQIEHI